MLQILRNGSFRNLWVSSLLSTLGSQVSRLGLILYVFGTHGEIISLSLLIVVDTLPGAVAAPLAGAVVDGLSKRLVMVVSDLSRMILMLVILVHPSLGVIYLMTALHSVATVFFQPARSAAIPLIVKQEDLVRANGVEQSAANLTLIAGPVLGAILLRQFGLTATLLFDAASFLVSALMVARVTIRQVERKQIDLSAAGAVNEIKEGGRYLLRHPLALHLTFLLFVALIGFVAACAFYICHRVLRRSDAGPVNYHYWIHSQLSLSAKQESELEPIEAKFARRRDEMVAAIRESDRELAEALLKHVFRAVLAERPVWVVRNLPRVAIGVDSSSDPALRGRCTPRPQARRASREHRAAPSSRGYPTRCPQGYRRHKEAKRIALFGKGQQPGTPLPPFRR